MNKKVNIYPKNPITDLNPPIRSRVMGVIKSVDEIRKCIIARAIVEEVLSDGTTVTLNFGNYDKDNNPTSMDKTKAMVESKVAQKPAKEVTKVQPKVENVQTISVLGLDAIPIEPSDANAITAAAASNEDGESIDTRDPLMDYSGVSKIFDEEQIETIDAENL